MTKSDVPFVLLTQAGLTGLLTMGLFPLLGDSLELAALGAVIISATIIWFVSLIIR